VRHVRMLGLCLVALAAMAVSASTAFAAGPEFGQCVAKAGGKYADAACQTKAKKHTGTYEWLKASQVSHRKFRGEGGAGVLVTTLDFCERGDQKVNPSCGGEEKEERLGPIRVECTSENAVGEVSSSKGKINNVVVKFQGCKIFGSAPCSNSSNEGEIIVNTLKGSLGYINKANKEVGVDLNPAKKKGEFAKFTCIGTLTTIVGVGTSEKGFQPVYPGKGGGDGIISPITPVNQMTSTLTQVYTVNATEENIPSQFEGKPLQLLEDYTYNNGEPEYRSAWSKAGEEITNVNTGEEEVEIKA
jgi:hypothetical protein